MGTLPNYPILRIVTHYGYVVRLMKHETHLVLDVELYLGMGCVLDLVRAVRWLCV